MHLLSRAWTCFSSLIGVLCGDVAVVLRVRSVSTNCTNKQHIAHGPVATDVPQNYLVVLLYRGHAMLDFVFLVGSSS
jgi:hypothetical protein